MIFKDLTRAQQGSPEPTQLLVVVAIIVSSIVAVVAIIVWAKSGGVSDLSGPAQLIGSMLGGAVVGRGATSFAENWGYRGLPVDTTPIAPSPRRSPTPVPPSKFQE